MFLKRYPRLSFFSKVIRCFLSPPLIPIMSFKISHLSMFHIVFPHAFVLCPVSIVENTLAMPQTIHKFPIIHVSERVLRVMHTPQKPNMLAHAMLKNVKVRENILTQIFFFCLTIFINLAIYCKYTKSDGLHKENFEVHIYCGNKLLHHCLRQLFSSTILRQIYCHFTAISILG